MSKELIAIKEENGTKLVNSRELHEFLEIGKRYTTWITGRIKKYGFEENVDFTIVKGFSQNGEKGGRPNEDYIITIEMAKELCMLEKNEKGRQARKYFIDCEKKLKVMETPSYMIDDRVERAKVWITEEEARQALALENKEQKEELNELRPKGVFFDLVLENKKYLNISDIAREYNLSGRKLNQILKDKGVQVKRKNGKWELTEEFENKGYTKILLKTNPVTKQKVPVMFWTQEGRKLTKELLKEEEIFPITETGLIAK